MMNCFDLLLFNKAYILILINNNISITYHFIFRKANILN